MKAILANLAKAYVGECQARNRYTFYAKIAKQAGYEQISATFLTTAEQEKAHAKKLYEFINKIKENDEEIKIEAEIPNVYGDTKEN